MHIDFLRVDENKALHVHVPLHFINEEACVGVKLSGGAITHSAADVEISCLPRDLPEYIEIDMTDVELDATVHLSDIKLPEGVSIIALTHGEDHDLPIAAVHASKAGSEDEEDGAPAAEAASEEGESEGE